MSAATFPAEFNLADYFLLDRLAEGMGARTALRFGAHRYDYAEVAARTLRMARALRSLGVRSEERVLLILPDLPAFAWCFFGVLKAGAVIAMGNPDAPAKDLAYLLTYTRASVVLTVPRVRDALRDELAASPTLRAVVLTHDAATSDDPEAPVANEVVASTPRTHEMAALLAEHGADEVALPRTLRDDVAIWLFTSGSTGNPKAAVHTHRDFAYNTELYAKGTLGYGPDDVTVSVPRLYFGYATGTNLMFPFAVGACVGLYSERPTPESLVDAIARYRPTIVSNVPTMMNKLLQWDEQRRSEGGGPLDLSSVRFCLSAGEALPPTLLARWSERFGTEVFDGIGSAEMFHIYVSNRPGDVKPGSLGRAVQGYELKILPEGATGAGGEALPEGEIGVLWVAGDSVAQCYFQDRDKSFRTFHGRWCCTGDLFRLDAQGYLWFAGRADELLKISGLWVSPIEVEECLRSHPAVLEVAVIGVEHEAGMLSSKALVVHRDSYPRSDALCKELQDWVKARLAKHKYPREVELLDELPRNDRGKVDRKALRAREQEKKQG